MKRRFRIPRPIPTLLVAGFGLLWLLSYGASTQKLAPRSALLVPPASSVGWSDGALVIARTYSIPRRDFTEIRWDRLGFGYQRYDFDRVQLPYTPGAETFKAFGFKELRIPFWSLIVVILLPVILTALVRAVRSKRAPSNVEATAA